jgi:hypothetical protein
MLLMGFEYYELQLKLINPGPNREINSCRCRGFRQKSISDSLNLKTLKAFTF